MTTCLTQIGKKSLINVRFQYNTSGSGGLQILYVLTAASIASKYQNAIKEAEESERYYQGLCENLDPGLQNQWEAEMAKAQAERTVDIKAMDIFNPALENRKFCCVPNVCPHQLLSTAPSCAEKQLELMQQESETYLLQGSTGWLVEGLAIQEAQYVNPCEGLSKLLIDHMIKASACSRVSTIEKEEIT